jgi:hypothetical protein
MRMHLGDDAADFVHRALPSPLSIIRRAAASSIDTCKRGVDELELARDRCFKRGEPPPRPV